MFETLSGSDYFSGSGTLALPHCDRNAQDTDGLTPPALGRFQRCIHACLVVPAGQNPTPTCRCVLINELLEWPPPVPPKCPGRRWVDPITLVGFQSTLYTSQNIPAEPHLHDCRMMLTQERL